MDKTFKLFDFHFYDDKGQEYSDQEDGEKDISSFVIQMFGINETGETCSIFVEDYKPFFYVKVGNHWRNSHKNAFTNHLKQKLGKYYESSILQAKLIERKKLYGFDGGKNHRFLLLKFENVKTFKKAQSLWYKRIGNENKFIKEGYFFEDTFLELYEANIPPLLRFFHIREISPSGWIALPNNKTLEITRSNKKTTCKYEFIISYKNVIPLNDKETMVPYKIMSFDIEASSSHGDFPVPIKSYKKLATNIVDSFDKTKIQGSNQQKKLLENMIQTAFDFSDEPVNGIELVYPKHPLRKEELETKIPIWLNSKVRDYSSSSSHNKEYLIENMFETMHKNFYAAKEIEAEAEDSDSETEEDVCNKEVGYYEYKYKNNSFTTSPNIHSYKNKQSFIIDILGDSSFEREGKIKELTYSLKHCFPPLEGDKVTFIGSTFLQYGQTDPYLNHCIVLDSCDTMPVQNSSLETYDTEQEVLLAWTRLVQRENPDIIIGYNIFSFDYEFMFRRSQECGCMEDFLKLSRNQDEICGKKDYQTDNLDIDRSSITLASGTYDLSIIKMTGRVQIDMYNWFRKTENLTSYKLDYVGGYFIGDEVKHIDWITDADTNTVVSRIKTNNMTGLQENSYIHFEEINHSTDYYKEGKKCKVVCVNRQEGYFEVQGYENPSAKKVRWGLAKDDVSPKDIFRMTKEGPASRSVIAKYCIQDCNLVHYLMNKVDVMTDLIEMSKLCSIPLSFLVFRGQGIKLTSYVAKKCREKRTLMPVIEKGSMEDGYEGAIVLEPKCGLYLDTPVAVGDFASLYPSSMLSENLCPSSKVWTKIYNLQEELIEETGEKDSQGNYIYDNLPNYEYVDISFDTFRYVRKNPKAKAEKIKSGYKKCRFAQFKEGKAIMPSILEELLGARKSTRKLIPLQTDEFMKNVLDKRQLAYKVTANSLYGQLGAKTSTFYEPDIAASTTATGRLLLTYAKKVVEECYQDTIIETKEGHVKTSAEYIYGDTDSVFFTFHFTQVETGELIKGQKALELSIETAKVACNMVSSFLKTPHDFEYEKTFMPFCLLSKKRYVGILYEHDPTKGKRKEMGIVLKRRDNAPIVKDIYGGIIDILMKDQNIQKAIHYLQYSLQELVEGKVPIEKLIITKSLRSFYKNPKQIAHKVLADRIGSRDPGNKPNSGDRIPYVYIHHPNKKALQGEKIETPAYIKEQNLKIDYSFYISNQIMKPLLQLFGLILNNIWEMQNKNGKIKQFKKELETIKYTLEDPKKREDKMNKMKDKEVKTLLFDKYLRETNNIKEGNQTVIKYFSKKQ